MSPKIRKIITIVLISIVFVALQYFFTLGFGVSSVITAVMYIVFEFVGRIVYESAGYDEIFSKEKDATKANPVEHEKTDR